MESNLNLFIAVIKNYLTGIARLFRSHLIAGLYFVAQLCSAANLPSDEQQCRSNLAAVFSAIQSYRIAQHRLPDSLDDLPSRHLPTAESLRCPAVRVADGKSNRDRPNNAAAGQYLYEFAPRPLANELVRNLGITLRDWKEWQMGRIGSGVPIVRCTNHPHVLNLSFSGAIYESGPDWEDQFIPLVEKKDLDWERLLPENVHLEVVRIFNRDPATPASLIDLTEHYNGSLVGWLPWNSEENLAELPAGQTNIQGTPFDVRGVVQLKSLRYSTPHWPGAVSNINVGLQCRSLVFLQGTLYPEAKGMEVARFVIHFENGEIAVFPIKYGRQVLDWRSTPGKADNARPVWSGPVRPSGRKPPHLYAARWENPHPALKVHKVDFVSSVSLSAPFLVGLSAMGPENSVTTDPVE